MRWTSKKLTEEDRMAQWQSDSKVKGAGSNHGGAGHFFKLTMNFKE